MPAYDFVTLDVFTSTRFGGNPLAVFPNAAGLDSATMQLLAREFNMSEVAFIFPPDEATNSAKVRIFTPDVEVPFAGHPNVGAGWVLAGSRSGTTGVFRFEELAGLVEVEPIYEADRLAACWVSAPQPLTRGEAPSRAEIASCASLSPDDIGEPELASVGLTTICVPVSRETLARAECDPLAFRALAKGRPDLATICLLFLYARDGAQVHARMFAPLSGTIEDPATGSAAAALTALLLEKAEEPRLQLEIFQGLEMGRPSRILAEAVREEGVVRSKIGGECVYVLRGVAEV